MFVPAWSTWRDRPGVDGFNVAQRKGTIAPAVTPGPALLESLAPHEPSQGSRRAGQQFPAPDHRARPGGRHLRRAHLRRHAGRCRASRRRAARSGPHPHPLPARAERLPAHRPCEEHHPQLRPGPGIRRHLPPALRRHQSGEGGAGVRRRDRRCGALAGLRVACARARARRRAGLAPLLRERLFRLHVPRRRGPGRGRPRLRRRAERRRDPRPSRRLRDAGHRTARSAAARRRRTWRGCAR